MTKNINALIAAEILWMHTTDRSARTRPQAALTADSPTAARVG